MKNFNTGEAVARQSNMELLRIISMFMILVLHANFLTFGAVEATDFVNNPFTAWGRLSLQTFTNISVDVFVLISGWFGIRSSLKGFCKFFFQCVYFMAAAVAIELIVYGGLSVSIIQSAVNIVTGGSYLWFVPSYMFLYLLAPALNYITRNYDLKKLSLYTLAIYGLILVYGHVDGPMKYIIAGGYSPIAFIALYLLANIVRKYLMSHNVKTTHIILVFTACWGLDIAGYYFAASHGNVFLSYINPFVIAMAACMVMLFSKIRMNVNRTINYIAASTFAVYLIHITPNTFPHLKSILLNAAASGDTLITVLNLTAVISAVFAGAILLDQPRKWLWRWLSSKISWAR